MKRQLLFLTAFLTAVFMQAQVLSLAPTSVAPKAAAARIAPKAITPTDGQMWWGYWSGTETPTGLGTGAVETFDCAICIPAGDKMLGEATIKAIRFYCFSPSNVSMMKVWISKTLPDDIDNCDRVQTVNISKLTTGYNDVAFDQDYAINNGAVYVGFSFTIKSAAYPIPVGGDYVANATFIRSSVNVTSWMEFGDYGKLAMQVLVEGAKVSENCVTPSDFGRTPVEMGKTVKVPVKITNNGSNAVTSISYTITSGDNTSEEKSVRVSSLGYNASTEVNIPFEADAEEGDVTKILTITKVNGNENTAENNTATGRIVTVADLKVWPRTVLIEEFSTEYCGWCPVAAGDLHEFLENNPDLAKNVAVAVHHAGYYTDWLTVSASSSYTWLYNGGTYAPAFMYDRYAWDGKTAVESRQSNANGYKARVESRMSFPAYANVNLSAFFNEDKTKIEVAADCERSWDFATVPTRLTLFVTEDNIDDKDQASADDDFVHQHALRAVNTTWGKKLTWENNKATVTYTFSVNSAWKTDDLKVIGFIAAYDSTDATNCEVANAAWIVPTTAEGISTVKQNDADVVARYTIDGRRATTSQHGLNIIKMSDGTVRKVMVK